MAAHLLNGASSVQDASSTERGQEEPSSSLGSISYKRLPNCDSPNTRWCACDATSRHFKLLEHIPS